MTVECRRLGFAHFSREMAPRVTCFSRVHFFIPHFVTHLLFLAWYSGILVSHSMLRHAYSYSRYGRMEACTRGPWWFRRRRGCFGGKKWKMRDDKEEAGGKWPPKRDASAGTERNEPSRAPLNPEARHSANHHVVPPSIENLRLFFSLLFLSSSFVHHHQAPPSSTLPSSPSTSPSPHHHRHLRSAVIVITAITTATAVIIIIIITRHHGNKLGQDPLCRRKFTFPTPRLALSHLHGRLCSSHSHSSLPITHHHVVFSH